jgi:hypothetical protein
MATIKKSCTGSITTTCALGTEDVLGGNPQRHCGVTHLTRGRAVLSNRFNSIDCDIEAAEMTTLMNEESFVVGPCLARSDKCAIPFS